MPSEHISPLSTPQQLPPTPQTKLCVNCRCAFAADADNVFLSTHHDQHIASDANDHSALCRTCRDKANSRTPKAALQALCVDFTDDLYQRSHARDMNIRTNSFLERLPMRTGSSFTDSPISAAASSSSSLFDSPTFSMDSPLTAYTPVSDKRPSIDSCMLPPLPEDILSTSMATRFPPSPKKQPSQSEHTRYPVHDPFMDITRLRVRSQAHQCLYPGAIFQGTQKSGRHSYDVTVTIVDIDFSSSFLCGYLCIKGLTEDWPELTTYFDAEIIGNRYGFLTQNWGANEQEDMTHWARFPAFRHVKNKLNMPHGTVNGDTGGAVFMRWKERFLVPDHRVQDINGASFAGFYYVCVDFNSHPHPPSTTRSKSSHRERTTSSTGDVHSAASPRKPAEHIPTSSSVGDRYSRRDSPSTRTPSVGAAKPGPSAATMSGFYFHQNSEPYQQLSLQHVSESVSTSYELR